MMNILNTIKNLFQNNNLNDLELSQFQSHHSWYAFEKTNEIEAKLNVDKKSLNLTQRSLTVNGQDFKFNNKDEKIDHYLKFLKIHHSNIAQALSQTKEALKQIEPLQSDGEEQDLEWFNVSLKVAVESIKNFNPLTSTLEYKFFSGYQDESKTFVLRVIYYNLDIVFEINDEFTYRIRDNKGTNDPKKYVIKEKKITSLYNDFFNILITFLVELKNTETKIVPIECES